MYNTCLTSSPEYSYFFLQIDDAIECPIASLLKALRILEDFNYYICSCYTTHFDLIFQSFHFLTITLRKKSPYSELFWSTFFPDFQAHSDWIGRDTEYLSVFSPNVGKSMKHVDHNNSKDGLFWRRVNQ